MVSWLSHKQVYPLNCLLAVSGVNWLGLWSGQHAFQSGVWLNKKPDQRMNTIMLWRSQETNVGTRAWQDNPEYFSFTKNDDPSMQTRSCEGLPPCDTEGPPTLLDRNSFWGLLPFYIELGRLRERDSTKNLKTSEWSSHISRRWNPHKFHQHFVDCEFHLTQLIFLKVI